MIKLYGIFDQNENYKLLRYSTFEQSGGIVQGFDYPSKTYYDIDEVCLPDIDYSETYIGQYYDTLTNTFSPTP